MLSLLDGRLGRVIVQVDMDKVTIAINSLGNGFIEKFAAKKGDLMSTNQV